jgi:hypothetical protein
MEGGIDAGPGTHGTPMLEEPTFTCTDVTEANVYWDLTAARYYLGELGLTLSKAAISCDPREVWLALALVRGRLERLK